MSNNKWIVYVSSIISVVFTVGINEWLSKISPAGYIYKIITGCFIALLVSLGMISLTEIKKKDKMFPH